MDLIASPARRRLLFTALYFSEGAPIGFLWWYLPTRLAALGVPVESTTSLSALLVLPWTLKFLWAPLVDVLRSARWNLKRWIVSAQLLMAASLAPLLWLDLSAAFSTVVAVLLVHALAAATQDVAVDALTISVTSEEERGSLNGFMQAGMLAGRSLFGGALLMLPPRLAPLAPAFLIAAIAVPLLLLGSTPVPTRASADRPRGAAFLAVLKERRTWLGLALAATAAAGFEGIGAVAGPWLIARDWSEAAVGRFLAVWAVVAMALGAVLGGFCSDRWGRRRVVAGCVLLVAVAAFGLAAADTMGSGRAPALGAVYFAAGALTASSYALFMDLTDPRLGATQFSAFMAGTNGCEAWSALGAGRIAGALGYARAFQGLALASLLALPILALLGRSGTRSKYPVIKENNKNSSRG